MTQVRFDHRAVTINGERRLILSGAIHYPRSTPAMWPELFRRSREAGLNTVETYVFWNLHERRRGVFDFSDRLDLRRFCALAQEAGLHVILRIGPYICAETNYGGFPAWLRDVPGMRMRTDNEPFKREMANWVRLLCRHLDGLFAPQGGPIILAQIENEYENVAKNYGEAGQRYLAWAVRLGESLRLGVPWIMCYGASEGAIETINAFQAHRSLDDHFARHPDQPALWTEDWPGWYGVWGAAYRVRRPEEIAYAAARFIAAGGSGINYYMWHGGTNFDREAMYLQTTSYDFNAPLDECGLTTTKSNHLSRLHAVLHRVAPTLLAADRPQAQPLGGEAVAFTCGDMAVIANDSETDAARVDWRGASMELPPWSARIFIDEELVFDSHAIDPADVVARRHEPADAGPADWASLAEPLPADREPGVAADQPVEQLGLTRDESDYCWYSTTLTADGPGQLVLEAAGDVVHVFVDGRLAASTPDLEERLGRIDGDGRRQAFDLDLSPGEHDLAILCAAVGLIKGDWMLGQQNMADERKGLWGRVRFADRALTGWTMRPGLWGERVCLPTGAAEALAWGPVEPDAPLRWHRATFDRPAGDEPLVLDMQAMTKGLAWINGRCIGRHWLVAGTRGTDDWHGKIVVPDRVGEPSQRFYHVPRAWLGDRNTLVVFEEVAGDPRRIRLLRIV